MTAEGTVSSGEHRDFVNTCALCSPQRTVVESGLFKYTCPWKSDRGFQRVTVVNKSDHVTGEWVAASE